jgi:hypothetical protein
MFTASSFGLAPRRARRRLVRSKDRGSSAPAGQGASRSTRPLVQLAESTSELRAVGLRAARCPAEHLLGSGGVKMLYLRANALAVRRDSRIAVNYEGN